MKALWRFKLTWLRWLGYDAAELTHHEAPGDRVVTEVIFQHHNGRRRSVLFDGWLTEQQLK